MHARGIKVVPFISNHWDRPLGLKALENRVLLASQIAAAVTKYNLDGVDIDIENVTHANKNEYTDFTRRVKAALKSDKILSVATAANPYGYTTGWHGSYDYKGLAEACTYLMIMNYDESYAGSPAGPVSSADFFRKSLEYAVKQGVPRSKIVCGIPFFGRYWKRGAESGGSGLTARDVKYLAANYKTTVYYDAFKESARAEVTITAFDVKPVVWGGRTLSAGTYDIWYDDLRAVEHKLGVINNFDLRGVGAWALGQEDPDVWQLFSAPEPQAPSEPEPVPPPPELIPDPEPESEPIVPSEPEPPAPVIPSRPEQPNFAEKPPDLAQFFFLLLFSTILYHFS